MLKTPWNIAKHSRECHQTFQGMLPNIPRNIANHSGNVVKHSGECPQIFKDCCQIFWEMWPDILESVLGHSGECLRYSRDDDAGSVQDFMELVVQNIAWNL